MATFIHLTQRIPDGDGWVTRPVQLNLRFLKDYLPIKDDPALGSVVISVGPMNTVLGALKGRGGGYCGSPAMLVSESVSEIDRLIRASQ